MPGSLPGMSTHSGRAPAGAQSFRFETSQELRSLLSVFFQRWRWYAIHRYMPLLLQRVALFTPVANSTVHGNNVGISHFLQVVGCESGAEAAATIEDQLGIQIRILILNIAFDDALAQMDGSGQVIGVEFAVFADVDENELVPTVEPGFYFVNIGFADALLGVFDYLQKARWMLLSHGCRSLHTLVFSVLAWRMIAAPQGVPLP